MISTSSNFLVKHDKILHSDGGKDPIPIVENGKSIGKMLKLSWNHELIFNGKLLYALGRPSVYLYRNGAQVLKTVGCEVQDSAWRLQTSSCVQVKPETEAPEYSTVRLWITSTLNHLDHIHMEKYGD